MSSEMSVNLGERKRFPEEILGYRGIELSNIELDENTFTLVWDFLKPCNDVIRVMPMLEFRGLSD